MWKQGLVIGIITFILAIIISTSSNLLIELFQNYYLALIFLFMIIFVGIIFDMIGVAATAAECSPFHAKASKKVPGSRHCIVMVNNADKVASFCNDVIGDICGTVSGALGTAIVFMIVADNSGTDAVLVTTFVTSLIAAVTVGGKAVGKTLGIYQAEKIIFRVGRFIASLEKWLGISLYDAKRKPGRGREKVSK